MYSLGFNLIILFQEKVTWRFLDILSFYLLNHFMNFGSCDVIMIISTQGRVDF